MGHLPTKCVICGNPLGRTWIEIQGVGKMHLAGNAGEKPNCYQVYQEKHRWPKTR